MAWTQSERNNWFSEQKIHRSYAKEVVAKIKQLGTQFQVKEYGSLSINPDLYKLYLLVSQNFDPSKKSVLITGGVHGYETSGVHGALSFLERSAYKFEMHFNILCAPCISPWAYETINRWNPEAIDPNRSFYSQSPAEECRNFLSALESIHPDLIAHFDLHETTDTDYSVFRPALEQRDGKKQEYSEIPNGFYVVADAQNPQLEFQEAIISRVRMVTHIAPADEKGCIIGEPLQQAGVICYEAKKLNLCAGFSKALYTTTTEVYPDSPKVNSQICVDAQIAAIEGGLDYILKTKKYRFPAP
jgi:hypothetical protein